MIYIVEININNKKIQIFKIKLKLKLLKNILIFLRFMNLINILLKILTKILLDLFYHNK